MTEDPCAAPKGTEDLSARLDRLEAIQARFKWTASTFLFPCLYKSYSTFHVSTHVSINMHTCMFIHRPINMFAHMFLHMSMNMSEHMSIHRRASPRDSTIAGSVSMLQTVLSHSGGHSLNTDVAMISSP